MMPRHKSALRAMAMERTAAAAGGRGDHLLPTDAVIRERGSASARATRTAARRVAAHIDERFSAI